MCVVFPCHMYAPLSYIIGGVHVMKLRVNMVSVVIVCIVKTRHLHLCVFTKMVRVIFDYSTVSCDCHVAYVRVDHVVEWS